MAKYPERPPEYFKVGDMVVHQGTDHGHHAGKVCTIIEPLQLVKCIHHGTIAWCYKVDITSVHNSNYIAVPHYWLKKYYPPADESFHEMINTLKQGEPVCPA